MNDLLKHLRQPNPLHLWASITLLLLGGADLAQAQSTAFTYNGRLNNNGAPVNGAYDMRFTIYDASDGNNVIAGPLPVSPVAVANGLFTVRIDFGAGVFTGPPRWLNVEVQPTVGGGGFVTLTPRQEVTSSPYSIRAATAGSVADSSVAANQLNTAGVAPTPGQFLSYNGGNLFWADPGVAAGNIWSQIGTTAYYTAGGVGIGTSTPEAGYSLEVTGATRLTTGGSGGVVRFGTPNAETGMTIIGAHRADIRFDGQTLKLLASAGTTSPSVAGGIVIATNGSVGVGTFPAPGNRLDVNGAAVLRPGGSGGGVVQFFTPSGETGMSIVGANRADVRFDGSTLKLLAGFGPGAMPSDNGITVDTSGNVGIGKKIDFGARLGQHLNLWSDPAFTRYFGIGIQDSTLYNRCGSGGADGFVWYKGGIHDSAYHNGGGGQLLMSLDSNGMFVNSSASVCSLTIRGGCDLAEPFPMQEAEIEKGSVVVIDKAHPGQLKRSERSYDKRVAGIVSGANGINSGISLHQEGLLEGGHNVALTGRVYVLADAGNGEIEPGDLLTTSDTPGHAMKVSDQAKAQGAILGKAMSGLAEGKGMVLVLVTLQ